MTHHRLGAAEATDIQQGEVVPSLGAKAWTWWSVGWKKPLQFCTFKNAIQKVKTTAGKTFSKPRVEMETHMSPLSHEVNIILHINSLLQSYVHNMWLAHVSKHTDRNVWTTDQQTPTAWRSWIPGTKVRLSAYSKSLAPLRFSCRVSSGTSFSGRPSGERKQTLIHFPTDGSPRARQRPPGGCPAAAAPRTRMFGLENDFATPSAPFSNCPSGNYLVSFPLKKNQEL